MFKIVFHDIGIRPDEVYGGGTYWFQKEKYAIFNDGKPKLFKSENVAENVAKQLLESCVNTGVGYTVEEV